MMRYLKVLWVFVALMLAIVGVGQLRAATSTTTVLLNNTTWTSLGTGPVLLSATGTAVYAVSDTTPSLAAGVGYPIPVGQSVTVNTGSTVWAMAVNAYGQTKAIVAPILASGTGAGSGVTKVMGNLGVPMLLPPSGTMAQSGANAQVTFGTALPVVYPSIYIYFQAAAVYPSSPAGWYYSSCSSTTVCTVYNNIYTSGSTLIPATLTSIPNATAGAVSSPIATNIISFSVVIPANTLGPNGYLQFTFRVNNNNSANSKQTSVSFAGALGFGTLSNTTNTQSSGFSGAHTLGVTNKVEITTLGNYNFGNSTNSPIISTLDTTINQSLYWLLQLANAADWILLDSAMVQLLPQGAN